MDGSPIVLKNNFGARPIRSPFPVQLALAKKRIGQMRCSALAKLTAPLNVSATRQDGQPCLEG
jgi:hypothetical protein